MKFVLIFRFSKTRKKSLFSGRPLVCLPLRAHTHRTAAWPPRSPSHAVPLLLRRRILRLVRLEEDGSSAVLDVRSDSGGVLYVDLLSLVMLSLVLGGSTDTKRKAHSLST